MPTTISNTTGTHLHDSPIATYHHVNRDIANGDKPNGDHAKGDHITLDARVHWIGAAKSNTPITILLRKDGQFIKSIVEPESVGDDPFKTAQQLTTESLVRISGSSVSGHEHAVDGTETIRILTLITLSEAKLGLPKSLVSHGGPNEEPHPLELSAMFLQERLNNRILDARVAANGAIFKLYSGVYELLVEHLASLDFCNVPTPGLINYEYPGDEHEQFPLTYFDNKQAWLSQTGDFHLSMALSADLNRVYDIHKVFRREENVSARHLTEFTVLELLWALKRDWTEILEFADKMLIFLIRSLQEREKYKALRKIAQRLYPAVGTFRLGLDGKGRLIRIKFSEAKKILRESLGWHTNDQDDISREEEAALGRFLSSKDSTLGPPTDVFIITHFPKHLRPFNVYPSKDGDTTNSFDIILRGREISTSYQMMHSYKELRSAMATRRHPIDPDVPGWRSIVGAYDIGMPPLGGIALGLNRFVQGFLGLTDIHETVLFPRDASRLSP